MCEEERHTRGETIRRHCFGETAVRIRWEGVKGQRQLQGVFSFFLFRFGIVVRRPRPQWGAADAEVKVPIR